MFVNLPRAIPKLAFNCNEPNIFFCSLTLRSHNFLRIQRIKKLKLSLCRFMAKFCFPKVSLWIKLRASFQWLYRVLNLHLNNSLVFNHRKELNQSKVLYFNKSFDFSWLLRVCLSLYNFWKPAKLTEISISINCVWKKSIFPEDKAFIWRKNFADQLGNIKTHWRYGFTFVVLT